MTAIRQPRDTEELARQAEDIFAEEYGSRPAGTWAAPGRANLIGDHVDYAGGICVPIALPLSTVAAAAPRGDTVIRAVSITPDGDRHEGSVTIDEICEGSDRLRGHWLGYVAGPIAMAAESGVVPRRGIDFAITSSVPLGSGLSSSAAVECAALLAAAELAQGQEIAMSDPLRDRLIGEAIRAENEVVGANTGGLDQRASLSARAGQALVLDFRDGSVRGVPFDLAAAGLTILIVDTRAPHRNTDGQYGSRRGLIDDVATALGGSVQDLLGATRDRDVNRALEDIPAIPGHDPETVKRRVRHVLTETLRAQRAADAVTGDPDFARFGELMAESHASLRDDFEVVTPELQSAVDAAHEAGSLGARMTGGGFGGSVVALVPRENDDAVAEAARERARERGLSSPICYAVDPSQGARRVS